MRRLLTIALWILASMTVARALPAPRGPHASVTLPGWFGHEGETPRRITGRLLERGVPVAGTVHLRIDAPDPTIWTGLDVEAGPDGRFDFGALRPGAYQVLATSPGRASRIFAIDTTKASADGLAIYIAPCTMIRAHLTAGSRPVAGARVELAGVLLATSDADGRVAVCSTYEWSLATIRAPGYQHGTLWLGDVYPKEREIELRADWPVSRDLLGAVDEHPPSPRRRHPFLIWATVTLHGKPLPDALVELSFGDGCIVDPSQPVPDPVPSARTDADGDFALDVPFEGALQLKISDAFGVFAYRSVAADAGKAGAHLRIEVAIDPP